MITKKFQEHIAKAIAMQQKVLDSIAIKESTDPQLSNPTSDDLAPDPSKAHPPTQVNTDSSHQIKQSSQTSNKTNNESPKDTESPPPSGSNNSRDQV